jgi:hypothetical protein
MPRHTFCQDAMRNGGQQYSFGVSVFRTASKQYYCWPSTCLLVIEMKGTVIKERGRGEECLGGGSQAAIVSCE